MKHSGKYTRKVIVDKYPPEFESKVKQFNDPNGIKYELTLTLPDDTKAFLDFYNTELINQMGESAFFFKSPWIFADGRENHRKKLGK